MKPRGTGFQPMLGTSRTKALMPNEIEAKMKVESFDQIRDALKKGGAKRIGSVFETNTFFDSSQKNLVAKDTGLRLRRTRDDKSGEEKFIITVKGPQGAGELKNRPEAEVGVENGKDAKAVLEALGYSPTLSFEKRRESWKFGQCKIELDEMPVLGKFVEIEGPDEKSVMGVREKLGMNDAPLIRTGYATMLAKYLKEKGDSRRVVKF
jgi:adenylate cyclase class 2